MIPQNEDKGAWVKLGENAETFFVQRMFSQSLSVMKNPAKVENPYTHDLFITLPADLKTIRTPFRTASRYGFDPDYAVTINDKDVKRYLSKYPHIVLILDIQYPNYQGIHLAPIDKIRVAIEKDKAKLHEYIHRVDDTAGNAKLSWVFDCRWFQKLGD
jgi:hypothetical protein